MKIAYLILCHTDPEHIRRLTNKITEGTENEAFIHVDEKVDIDPFQKICKGNPSVHFVSKRWKVTWGGYSSVEATIELLKSALQAGKFERFVLLQGLDYPIKNNVEIDHFFMQHPKTEYIKAQDISHSNSYHETHKYRLYWVMDNHSYFAKGINKFNLFLIKKRLVPHFRRNYVYSADGNKMFIYQGAAQFGLTKEAAEYISNFYDNNPRVNRYFKHLYAPDESYFHTIIYNSEFVKRTVDGEAVTRGNITSMENLTYFEYPDKVVLFTKKKDWNKLRDSGFLYFRKASSESKELLDYIDSIHAREQAEQ